MNLNATLIIEVLSFLILLGLLIKFLYRPVLNLLDKRAKEIQEKTDQIQQTLTSANQERRLAEQMLAETKQKALEIREKAHLDAEILRQRIANQSRDEAEKIIQTAQQEIVRQTHKAKEKIGSEIIKLSLKTAEQILHRKFTAKDQKQLLNGLVKGIKDGTGKAR